MIGRKIIHKDTVDSTNNYIAKLLSEGNLADGTVIMADKQFAGRGQRGNSWYTEEGKNLIFSCYVEYHELPVQKQEVITHVVSLSLLEVFNIFNIQLDIKWPNDLLFEGKKVAGILIENQLERNLIKSSIIGIGCNINQLEFPDLHATSLAIISRKEHPIHEIAVYLIHALNKNLELLKQKQFSILKNMYLSKLWLLNQRSFFKDEFGVFSGKIIGTSEYGQLLVEKDNTVRTYDLKEIEFLEGK
jgi:BirA family transcriptional regulator, biotin operon repressor / biotin---[acetyl-CoA-carboxylase] ligase